MRASDEVEFRAYVNGHFVALRRTAFFICGDWHRAEGIVQMALTKLHRSWRRSGSWRAGRVRPPDRCPYLP